ncbi:MAG: DUF3568 domain-containing protein [Syntrophales bacterium]|nr:DUF3568 domain-containing protein [Syntrophales bacterium]
MRESRPFALFLLAALLVVSCLGCTAAVVGTAAVGTGIGTYIYFEGVLKTDYYYPFEQVWKATERALNSLKATEVLPTKKIGEGSISCVINGQKVWIKILYKDKNVTNVGVRVGVLGDERASKMIHGVIQDHVKN